MEIRHLYELFLQSSQQVSTDTRKSTAGSIFFALSGANFNGNEYAHKAIEQGCSYAVVDEEKYADDAKNIILVDNVLQTLQDLAHYHRSKFKIPVIAITGTNGKTTTKELVASVLSQEYKVLWTQGNLNNHIGVPLTLLQLTKEHEIAVIEMGASHVGEIATLAKIADPTFGLITNLGYAHLESFGSFENIVKAKTELYEYLRNRKEGKIFLDHQNSRLRDLSEGITAIEYGTEKGLFVVGELLASDPYLTFKWKFSQKHHIVETNLIGEYNLPNALAAIAIGKYFGIRSAKVCDALREYTPTNNRSQLKETSKNKLIVDAYNANPTSMMAALSNFSNIKTRHKALILGDMRELGVNSDMEHQKVIDYIKNHDFDKVYLIGENFKHVDSNGYSCFKDVVELNDYLSKNPLSDYYVLIKGSRGNELEKSLYLL